MQLHAARAAPMHAAAGRQRKKSRKRRRELRVLVPVVRVTGVLPQARTWKLDGALMSYHSFLVKGSTLQEAKGGRCQRGELRPRGPQAE